MDTLDDDRDVQPLDEAECLRLLDTAPIGRIAFTEGALPAVQPVTFTRGDREIYVPTHQGSAVAVASRGAVVAFEVDEVDVGARTGWNVTVVGPSRLITDPAEVRRLDGLGIGPWVPSGAHCYVGVQVRLVRGRWIGHRPATAEGTPGLSSAGAGLPS
ncbi:MULTISPECIES: pyridoxamine 5'-phosphate oxidase family protein [unclassified Modestobacter]|uniref:pyridoxamine 5'-phosphate oxidase family protein n=1 Tax=unclassified Modestobacter TaxID=2643866 RepID=UPI0022AAA59F|nr:MULTISPECIES: pyridoxamine 5'-phosphate oxidase family protein [unclassified Modestobacter]MCZ2826307.1 pyridoxamine 5'-phosphate oxidase family protein [Modestobacter sp. VKM Ac-2981]MCZ2852628.1 pyridoxamine 5'-phosphate oxidase family protein [Modestobacter sp. VKM Ac-2982]